MDFTVFNLIWLLVLLSVRITLYHIDHSVLCQVCDKKVKKKTAKHIRHIKFPTKYRYIPTGVNRIARPRIKEYIYKLCTENGLSIYGRSQNYCCFAIPFTSNSRENSWRPVIRLGTTRLDNTTPIVRSESQENGEQRIEDLLRIRNLTCQAHRSDYPIVGSLYIDNNSGTENPENGACEGTLTEHFVSLTQSNLSTMPGFPSFPSSELPSPNSNDISTELNSSSTFEEPTAAISGEKIRMRCQSTAQQTHEMETITSQTCTSIQQNRDLRTNRHTEKTAEPTTMAFKLHLNQDKDNGDSSHCRLSGGKLRNVGTSDDTTEQQGGARPKTDKNKTSAHALVNSDPMISIRGQRSHRKRANSKEKTSNCDTDIQKCITELSNTQTGSAMQLPAGGDEVTNAAALTDIPDVNISENKGPFRTFPENEKSSTRNTKSKSHPPTTMKERRFNEKGIKNEARIANHACPKEMESENVEERQVVSTETPNSIRDVAIGRNLNAPSEDDTLAITEFDNIDQRTIVDSGVSRSILDNNSSDVIQTLKDK